MFKAVQAAGCDCRRENHCGRHYKALRSNKKHLLITKELHLSSDLQSPLAISVRFSMPQLPQQNKVLSEYRLRKSFEEIGQQNSEERKKVKRLLSLVPFVM